MNLLRYVNIKWLTPLRLLPKALRALRQRFPNNSFNRNSHMKTCIVGLALVLALVSRVIAQATPTLEEQLTTFWKQKNYTELRNLLDAKASATPPDVVALYCSKFFYVFVQPDKGKALAAVTKLKTVAEATTDADFMSFANEELAEVQGIPATEFTQPRPEILTALHTEFADRYPNVEIGARLRKYKNP